MRWETKPQNIEMYGKFGSFHMIDEFGTPPVDIGVRVRGLGGGGRGERSDIQGAMKS